MSDETRLADALDKHTSAICALIEAMGMHWENQHRQSNDNSPMYGEDSFLNLIARHDLRGF